MIVPMVDTLAAWPLTKSRAASNPQNCASFSSSSLMDGNFACHHSARRYARAVSIERAPRGLGHGRVFVETKVVAPCEVEARLTVDHDARAGAPFLRTKERAIEPNQSSALLEAIDVPAELEF